MIRISGFIWRAESTTNTFSESLGNAQIKEAALLMPALINTSSSFASPIIKVKSLFSIF